jgi:peptidoglycan hydrolase-like protein with peptidoglycan-binding domain
MKTKYVTFFVVGMAMLTGCISKSQYETEVRGLRGHIVNLTNQVTRLDSDLQSAQQFLAQEREANDALKTQVDTLKAKSAVLVKENQALASAPNRSLEGIYRTPSGFELPALDIQKALVNAGYLTGSVDGKIGPATRQAIREFQTDQGLEVDGVCGEGTWKLLRPFLNAIK